MMTKFNKDMYARMRGKKDEPLSATGAKTVHVTERGAPISSVPPSTPTLGTVGIASPTPLIEELTSQHKRPRTGDKQKEKVDSRSSSVWDDAGVALARAQDVFNADDLKVFSGVSANKVVGRHLHKLVQVPMQIYILHSSLLLSFFFFFFFFSSGVGRESPPHLRVPGSGGQGQVWAVPCDDLGGKQFETKERSNSCHEKS